MNQKILSLFAGVGCLERAVELVTGGHVTTQVELEPYRRAVLAKHWPDAQRFEDIKEYRGSAGSHEIICGGFPCRDISPLGSQKGLAGAKSGLWFEYARIVKEIQPRAVFIENVRQLRTRGLTRVIGDLTALGYDCVWKTDNAREHGASVNRWRVFILAVSKTGGRDGLAAAGVQKPQLCEKPDTHGRYASVPSPADGARGIPYEGPKPGVYRASYGNPRGVDARRRRNRVAALGDTVSIPQAIAAYSWCVDALAPE